MKLHLYTALAAATFGIVTPAAGQSDRFEWNGRLERGDVVEIKNLSGDVRAVAGRGPEVEVRAVKRGRRRDFDQVDIEVVEWRGGVLVCALYPGRRGRRSECDDEGWNGDMRDLRVDIDFEIVVPPGVEFVGRTVSGDVEAEGLDAPVKARTVSGDISVSTTDFADATTVSGSIEVRMGRADWRGELDFTTVSGDITVTLPEALSTEIEFESLSGDIESDFAIALSSRRGSWGIGGRVRGTIGDGGRSLSFKTVSGDVRLRRP